eukprot:2087895-Prymnesium_polylepis.3
MFRLSAPAAARLTGVACDLSDALRCRAVFVHLSSGGFFRFPAPWQRVWFCVNASRTLSRHERATIRRLRASPTPYRADPGRDGAGSGHDLRARLAARSAQSSPDCH